MWTYSQSSGDLLHDDVFEGTGYSGHGLGRNNSNMQADEGIGPIPCGKYQIGPAYIHPHLGPCVMALTPIDGTDTFGRSLFRIHGNNKANDASEGCIILGPSIRNLIAHSGDHFLTVIP